MSLTHKLLPLLFLTLLGGLVHAQLSYADINMEAIPFRKVKLYLDQQQQNAHIEYLAELKSSCEVNCDLSDFYVYKKTYHLKAEKWKVWETYKNASPTQSWSTRKSTCAMVYERSNDQLHYPTDEVDGIQAGQVLFMDLKLLKGLYHLATSFEITKVEDEMGVIQIDYTDAGVNQGMQIIRMFDTEEGYTLIEHASIIRSGHQVRDRYLYPFFHNKLINAFHRKMRRMVYEESLIQKEHALR
jgi:hypothetical protein